MPIHLHPTASLAPRVLLPGDPGRALLLAQVLIEQPKMFNHHRGLWGYSGTAVDGHPLTIQSTGMGGPSAAIVAAELIELGAERLVRVGTCGALSPELELGALVVAGAALAQDGCSQALGASTRVDGSPGLVAALERAGGGPAATVVSSDVFYEERRGIEQAWAAAGAVAVEMEAATLFTLAARHGRQAAALLIVSDRVIPSRARIDTESLRAAERRAGEVALAALG